MDSVESGDVIAIPNRKEPARLPAPTGPPADLPPPAGADRRPSVLRTRIQALAETPPVELTNAFNVVSEALLPNLKRMRIKRSAQYQGPAWEQNIPEEDAVSTRLLVAYDIMEMPAALLSRLPHSADRVPFSPSRQGHDEFRAFDFFEQQWLYQRSTDVERIAEARRRCFMAGEMLRARVCLLDGKDLLRFSRLTDEQRYDPTAQAPGGFVPDALFVAFTDPLDGNLCRSDLAPWLATESIDLQGQRVVGLFIGDGMNPQIVIRRREQLSGETLDFYSTANMRAEFKARLNQYLFLSKSQETILKEPDSRGAMLKRVHSPAQVVTKVDPGRYRRRVERDPRSTEGNDAPTERSVDERRILAMGYVEREGATYACVGEGHTLEPGVYAVTRYGYEMLGPHPGAEELDTINRVQTGPDSIAF